MTRRQINPTGPRSSVPPLPLTVSFSVSSTRGSDEENQDEEQEEEEEMVPGAAGDSLMTPCSRYTTALHTLSTHSVHTHADANVVIRLHRTNRTPGGNKKLITALYWSRQRLMGSSNCIEASEQVSRLLAERLLHLLFFFLLYIN